jgi:hypothetical protein
MIVRVRIIFLISLLASAADDDNDGMMMSIDDL